MEAERGGEGGRLRVRTSSGDVSQVRGAELAGDLEPGELESAEVTVRLSEGEARLWRGQSLLGSYERMGAQTEATLHLMAEGLVAWGPSRAQEEEGRRGSPFFELSLLEIRAIQTSSSSLQVAARDGSLIQIRFREDSPRRWEVALQRAVQGAYRRADLGEISEFQPRIVSRGTMVRASGPGNGGARAARKPVLDRLPPESKPPVGRFWYSAIRSAVRPLVTLASRLEVRGRENLPREGPFVLIANHQSFLDPVLVQTLCPRVLHTFTKSTEFARPIHRWFLRRLNAIPTRRYTVDPQVIRVALRCLRRGEGVCIYAEGERSWDGTLQPFRQGTIRFLLGAGVPVIPCGIDGSFDAWPRWSRRIRRSRIRVSFGEPISWGPEWARGARYAKESEADQELRAALVALGAWTS